MDLAEARQEIVETIESDLVIVASGGAIQETSRTLDQLSRCFQALAICRLIESGDPVKFRDNLARSGFARRFFLRKSKEAKNTTDRRLALSQNEAFFDALAAGHDALAREIAALSDTVWHKGWEYKEDHGYIAFLHQVVREPTSALDAPLQAYEAALEGDQPPRLAVLQSIVERDQAAFNAALRQLMEQVDQEMQQRGDRLSDSGLEACLHEPKSQVCIEGLALISLAATLGLQVDAQTPLCPTAGRLAMSNVSMEDPFLGIEERLRGYS